MKKLENISNDEIKKSVANEISTLDEQIKKLESKKQEYVEKETELSEKIGLYELQKQMDEMKMKGMGGGSLEV
jgi:predicted nuclease with TOPRIM domain